MTYLLWKNKGRVSILLRKYGNIVNIDQESILKNQKRDHLKK